MSKIAGSIADASLKLNGSDKVMGIGTVTLPEVNFKSEELTGLGMGTIEDVNVNSTEAMKCTLKFIGMSKELNKIKGKKINFVVAAALNKVDSISDDYEYSLLTANIRGVVKSRKYGDVVKGGKIEAEMEIAVHYYKLELDNEVIHEIDPINNITIVDGADLASAVNKLIN